jgi:hypothetical protein
MRCKGRTSWAAGFVAVVLLLVSAAMAEHEDWLTDARRLYAEAKPFIEQASDVEVDLEKRKAPRKEAMARVKKSRDLYNDYWDLNEEKLSGELATKIGDEMREVNGTLYWLKKESSIDDDDDKPRAPAAPPTPEPEKTGPAPKPPVDPGAPEVPPKNEAPSDFAFRAKTKLAAIEAYEKAHPGDVALVKKYYEQFLSDFSDPSLPEYAAAMGRLGRINDGLQTVLKEVAKRDPDTFKADESAAQKSVYGKLTSEFSSKDVEVRRRAAQLMASSRSRAAAHFLARGLCDKDEEISRICREGLIAVGGGNVGQKLVEFYRDAPQIEKQQAAFDVLAAIAKKGPVDAAAQSEWIGKFVVSNKSSIAEQAIPLLIGLGKAGGKGLMFGLESVHDNKVVDCLNALGQVKYYRAARDIGERFLSGGRVHPDVHKAAVECCKTLGPNAVPYLIPNLAKPWVAHVVREITGDMGITLGDRKQASAWWKDWKAKHPEEAEDKEKN